MYCKGILEDSLLAMDGSRRSQQKFLDSASNDADIRQALKGLGGNRVLERCIIVKQTLLDKQDIERIHAGELRRSANIIIKPKPWSYTILYFLSFN